MMFSLASFLFVIIIQWVIMEGTTTSSVDVSTIEKVTQHLTRPFTVNAAAYHQEVLIYGDIPQEAIIDFVGGY